MRLSSQAVRILEELRQRGDTTVEELEKEGYDQSMVHRAALELQENSLVDYEEEEEIVNQMTEKGQEVVEKGSPEQRLAERLEPGPRQLSELQDMDLDVALGKAREKNWVEIDQGEVRLTETGEEELDDDPVKAKLQDERFDDELLERGLVEETTSSERKLELTGKGEEL
ncbi:MAG: hypothetical protein ABEJ66_00415, partial [Candidatus Nanohaloarchaea archaeon]